MPSNSPEVRDERVETAAYIATLTGELASMARRNGLHTLEYLLDMAKLEAEHMSQPNGNRGT
jgi:hypothetical protein